MRDPLVTAIGDRIARAAGELGDLATLRSDRIVDACVEALRDLGKQAGHEVSPLRRGLGGIGWELAWGKNLEPDYARLSATDPKNLFQLALVAEVAELGLRAGAPPERIVEEAALDFAKLVWARADAKVLVFGAQRASSAVASLDAITAGLATVAAARDKDAEHLLVAFPNLGAASLDPPERWTIATTVIRRGAAEPVRERPLSSFFEATP